ncbi:transcription factor HIVEP2a [Kryptolebias marmoratus]|uniref:HIVEP zinc finger 2a n=1 Tax=Kryptolebias marmoratus TaxID=37003 RepID=A0A3Q3AUE1_KRYMA|nr:transcription factor HIVEP2a [Kryptolebias marmoratus]XP_017282918.1 transcription factor HIVEP2a [Kryptolebias marmoratus]XP_017282919.1 transcription factor HIVEP2a [Kryptolebias marmoratus]
MEAHESITTGQKCSNKEMVKEKVPLQRKWASEPTANTKQSIFADQEVKHRESVPCGATGGSAPQQKYAITGNSAKLLCGPSTVGAIGGPPSQDPQGPFAQGFPRGYSFQLGQPYPQHPQTERFVSGAKPQPGLEAHAWPFAGQLPSDDLYPVGHPGHTHPHGAGRFPRQKSPSLPSSFGQYSQPGSEPVEEGYGKKEQKPKKPGKYICPYCHRACAKPSVLKKHIRSHTGERPYPCIPCGFSFKTKSNLYKHRKSHAHAIKAGLVPFSSELSVARCGDVDQASSVGEAEVPSDGEQSTDTDEEGVDASTMLTDKDSPIPQISFEADKNAEPAYADSAEELSIGSMKVPILIFPKTGGIPPTGMECPPFHDIKGSHHMLGSKVGGRARSLDDSPTVKQRLALKLNDKGQDSDPGMSQSLNLLSPHSKGSTDSGYFSPFDSAELQISTPNANVKTYEEIMFGRTWYNRPNSRSRQSVTLGMAGADPSSLVSLKQSGAIPDMGKTVEDHISLRGNQAICGDAKQYPTGPCQSNTGLLEPPSDSATLIRSNSMPSPSPPNLSAPQGIRGSISFDNMAAPDDVFYPPGHPRLKRQTAFEQPGNEAHIGEAEGYGHMAKNLASSLGMKISERSPGVPEQIAYSPYGTKVSMSEIATRKRRKEKSVGDDEDSPGHCDSSCSGSVEMMGEYEFKQGSFDGSRGTPTGKGSFHSAHSQSDSFDTCASMCSEDIALFPDSEGRKAAKNAISVILHTDSLRRPNSFEKSESFEQPVNQPSDKAPISQYSEQSDTDIFEDALSPESALLKTESMEQQVQSDSDLASLSSSSAAPSPGQPYTNAHRLVRQSNIQVPEIRVTEEPDKPEKDTEAPTTKEAERQQQHVEEFQLPQRSDTLSQMPAEKLPPKKKRLRLADMEHSSGESSFESTCTSLSRSPSQESNLSHSSSLSMSFDRDEGPKSVSPTKQEDSMTSGGGAKQSEFLTVPGSGYSSHHQQREMRRSSSEQAPCTLPTELPEMRSKSLDYGSLPSSRQGELYTSASAMKERRRGYLVRQVSLSVYPEAVLQEPGGVEMSIKQESLEHGAWSSPTGSPHSSIDQPNRTKRAGVIGSHHQHSLQQSISEDSLQDEPLYGRSQQHRLQAQSSSSEGEHPGHDVINKDLIQQYQSSAPFISISQPGLFWNQESEQATRQQQPLQAQQQLLKLHIRSQGSLHKQQSLQQAHDPLPYDGKSESSQIYTPSFSSRTSPLSQQQQNLGALSSKLPSSTTASLFLQQIQPVFATQNLSSQASLPSLLVPVRIQTNVPSFGSAMYTSVSQLIASYGAGVQALNSDSAGTNNMSPPLCAASISKPPGRVVGGISGAGFNLSLLLGQVDGTALRYPLPPEQHLNTGIPLSLTSGTISTTDASASGIVASKRMLSPASSLERFIETKQQKRVKEERMYGQIVKEMGAVELSGAEHNNKPEKQHGRGQSLKSEDSIDDSERMSSSPPLNDIPTKIAIPVRSPAPHLSDVPRAESFTPPLQIITDPSLAPSGRDSPEELDVDEAPQESSSSPEPMLSSNDTEDGDKQPQLAKLSTIQSAGKPGAQSLLPSNVANAPRFFQFPSLRTMSRVSWCFRNYTKPNSTPSAAHSSVYSSWCVSSYNPNPLNLTTKATLALLRSKQRRNTDLIYTLAAVSSPSSGKLVSSVAWKLRFDQLKPELMPVDASHFGRKMKGVVSWDRSKDEQVEKEVSVKQPSTEPTRIKIFEGGYKSNEDYVYVRGRGRGKYICEECGIRCKKPSMLKKHIRTHTDVRPYVCKFCNFAFKTKGNLTKHMKSKAHMKKCLELGVSVSSVEETEAEEGEEEGHRSSEKMSRVPSSEHQFSDADESEGGEDDEVDDEDDEDDDYDGDSTPKTRSRSTSPQPYSLPSMSITAVAASHSGPHLSHQMASDLLGHSNKPPLFGYFTTVPSIQITPQAPPTDPLGREYQRGQERSRLQVPPSSSMDEELPIPSPDLSSSSSRLSSPGLDHSGCPSPISPSSSPSTRCYLSPRRDLSPRAGHLSPQRDISPLRHISPKRDLGGYRRDLSPRRRHLSVLSPLSRPTSPGGRDYKRDLSPRGRPRGIIRAVSPRRGLQQHLHQQSQQSGARGPRAGHQSGLLDFSLGRRSTSAEMEMEHHPGSLLPGERDQGSGWGNQSGLPHQVLFSHLPLHSQLQVRSPFPMIPIGGIQMVHSVPTSVTAPLAQQGAQPASSRLFLQKSTSEDSISGEASAFTERGRRGGAVGERGRESTSPHPSLQESDRGGVRQEQEETIHTCTKAIASLCIDSKESVERDGRDRGRAPPSSSSPSVLTSDPHQQQKNSTSSPPHPASSPPQPPGIQHFSGLELRPPHPTIPASPHSSSSSSSPHPHSPGSDSFHPPKASIKLENNPEVESTKRNRDVS